MSDHDNDGLMKNIHREDRGGEITPRSVVVIQMTMRKADDGGDGKPLFSAVRAAPKQTQRHGRYGIAMTERAKIGAQECPAEHGERQREPTRAFERCPGIARPGERKTQ